MSKYSPIWATYPATIAEVRELLRRDAHLRPAQGQPGTLGEETLKIEAYLDRRPLPYDADTAARLLRTVVACALGFRRTLGVTG